MAEKVEPNTQEMKLTEEPAGSFNSWPPTDRIREGVRTFVFKALSSKSLLTWTCRTIPHDEALDYARRIEEEALAAAAAAAASASTADDGIDILEVYAGEISKGMVKTVPRKGGRFQNKLQMDCYDFICQLNLKDHSNGSFFICFPDGTPVGDLDGSKASSDSSEVCRQIQDLHLSDDSKPSSGVIVTVGGETGFYDKTGKWTKLPEGQLEMYLGWHDHKKCMERNVSSKNPVNEAIPSKINMYSCLQSDFEEDVDPTSEMECEVESTDDEDGGEDDLYAGPPFAFVVMDDEDEDEDEDEDVIAAPF